MKRKTLVALLSVITMSCLCEVAFSQTKDKKKADDGFEKNGYKTEHAVEIPKFETRHLQIGDNFFKAGNYKGAYDEYYMSTRLNPSYWQGYRGLGNVFLKTGNIKKAINNYLKAISIVNPVYVANTLDEGQVALKEGDYFLAIAKFQKILAINPEAGAALDEGVKLLKENKKAKAEEKFKEAVKLDDDYADAHYKMGMVSYEKKKYPEAIKSFELAVKYEPSDYAYQYYLGNAYYKQANKDKKKLDSALIKKSIGSFSKAHELNQRDVDIMFNLASSLIDYASILRSKAAEKEANAIKAAGDKKEPVIPPDVDKLNSESVEISEKAVKLLEKVTAMVPQDSEAHTYLGNAYTMAAKNPLIYLKAVDEYQKAIAIDGSKTNLYFNIGVAYFLASATRPRSEDLPITKENAKQYIRFGKKYFKGDMLTYAQENFNSYLLYNLRDKNVSVARQYLATVTDQLNNLGFRVPDRTTGR